MRSRLTTWGDPKGLEMGRAIREGGEASEGHGESRNEPLTGTLCGGRGKGMGFHTYLGVTYAFP